MDRLTVLLSMMAGEGQKALPHGIASHYPEGSEEEPEAEGPLTCEDVEDDVCNAMKSCGSCSVSLGDRGATEPSPEDQDDVPSDTSRDPKSRYYDAGGIETMDIIRAKLTSEEFVGYLKGAAIKYLCRMAFKHEDQVRDSEKVAYYTKWLRVEMTYHA